MGYYLFHILGGLAVLTLWSELAVRWAPGRARAIKLAWNWGLLLSFLVCLTSGFALLAPVGWELRLPLSYCHVWGGTATAWAGLYHTVKRARGLVG
jgi:hypothetical protein